MAEESKSRNWHDKYYKHLLLIPLALLVLSLIYIGFFYSANNDFIYKDISLTGGTSVTIYGQVDTVKLKQDLSDKLDSINTRDISDIVTRERKAVIIETKSDGDLTRQVLEEYLGYELNEKNSSFEFTGSALSESFFKQLIIAVLFAFIFMAIVVFIIFRTFVPSSAVVISAFADILMTLTVANLFGIKMSSAGIVAFLMLIGYSVDTDILLTTRILKRHEGTINQKILGALKTGITMTLTSLLAIVFALIVVKSFSVVLTQIFTILAIGLGFDILNTWITNVSILKWYVESKNIK
ncbi:MAG: protein translocase subunit SecF [Nanoarchaeota archaeon]|nr:protein translocase subunit SecF [Nanoarchaeota archaeon]